jgi:hypothetical protein
VTAQRRPLVASAEGFPTEMTDEEINDFSIAGDKTDRIPLPKPLASHLFFSQGRGDKIIADFKRVQPDEFAIDTDQILLTKPVMELKVYTPKHVWLWSSAAQEWAVMLLYDMTQDDI